MINEVKVGLGILSYKAHETLKQTLESYEKQNLSSVFDDQVIYFNDFNEQDQKIADSFGYRAAGGLNIGFKAQEQLAQHINADYVLLTQNDCPLVEDLAEVRKQLIVAIELLESGKIDLMRFRHRWLVGEGFSDVVKYVRFYNVRSIDEHFARDEHGITEAFFHYSLLKNIKKYIRPFKARRLIGRSVYIEKNPEKLFPKFIQKEKDVLIIKSECIDYTEQSFLIKKEFFLSVLCRYINENPKGRTLHGFQVPEYILNCRWWRKMNFKIGVPKGLFGHNRFDDSFRKNHHAYNNYI